MVSVSDIASGSAIVFSGLSLWNTSLRAANLNAFVPPLIRYASPYQNSIFEVFEIPLTLINGGARTGTVLSVDLAVRDTKRNLSKRFYSACTGSWHREKSVFAPFTPLSLGGRGSQSETLLFYPRSDETVMQIVEQPGRFILTLTLNMAAARGGLVNRLFAPAKPAPVTFEMVLPMLDHRAFTHGAGTVTLNHPDWQASSNM